MSTATLSPTDPTNPAPTTAAATPSSEYGSFGQGDVGEYVTDADERGFGSEEGMRG